MNHSLFWGRRCERCALTLSSPESACAQSPIAARTERIGLVVREEVGARCQKDQKCPQILWITLGIICLINPLAPKKRDGQQIGYFLTRQQKTN